MVGRAAYSVASRLRRGWKGGGQYSPLPLMRQRCFRRSARYIAQVADVIVERVLMPRIRSCDGGGLRRCPWEQSRPALASVLTNSVQICILMWTVR